MTVAKKVQSKVPQLRFPEFSGEWKVDRVSSLATSMVPGRNKPKEFDGDIPWITIPDIRNRTYVSKSMAGVCLSEAEVGSIGLKIVPKNAVVMSCVGELGFSSITTERVVLNQQLHAYIPGDNIDTYFLKLAIETNRKYLYRFATKTSVLYLNQDNCNGLPISYSEKVEQKKISSFLSTIDKKISLLKQKHEQLVLYKKGIMQQLFSQQLRFKDYNGQDFPDWEVKTLGSLASKVSKKNKDDSIKNVLTNSAKQGIVNQLDYFDKDIANENNLTNYCVVEKDDFVYNPRISVHAPVGPIKRNNIDQGVMSPLYTVFRIKNPEMLNFLEIFFSTTQWYRYMNSIANFGARHDRMNITSSDFFLLPMKIPSDKERDKLVDFVKSLDKKINLTQQQIEQTQAYKKGLLQQMFV